MDNECPGLSLVKADPMTMDRTRYNVFYNFLQVFNVRMTDRPQARRGIVRQIRLANLAALQTPTLHASSSDRPLQAIFTRLDGEIRQRNFQGVAVDDRGQAEIRRVDFFVANVELKVPAVVEVVPVQFRVGCFEGIAVVVRALDGDVLTIRTRR